MARQLIIEEMSSTGRRELACVQTGEMVIGRDPDEGIKLDYNAISREHGLFIRVRNHWLYKDLGSTNGSWLNGNALIPEQWKIIRPGDYMQLADIALTFRNEGDNQPTQSSITGFPALGGRSLLVFSREGFLDEFLVPEYGRALVLGGSDCDIEIKGDIHELPALVIERRGMKVCGFSVAKEMPIHLNASEQQETFEVSDNDCIRVGEYLVVFNDPSEARRGEAKEGEAAGVKGWGNDTPAPDLTGGPVDSGTAGIFGGGSAEASPSSGSGSAFASDDAEDDFVSPSLEPRSMNSTFGQNMDMQHGDSETVTIDPAEMYAQHGNYDMPAARRSYMEEPAPGYSFSSLEDKIIILILLAFLLIVAVLVIWWAII